MKKIVALLLIAVLLFANCYATVVEVNIGGIQVNSLKDGEVHTVLLEEIPFVNESGRTMVPVRAITEAFGAEVSWDGDANAATIIRGEDKIVLTIDKNTALLNGKEITLDSAPVIKAGRTFVPLRFIGEAFGYNINYVASTKQIVIDDTPVVIKGESASFTFAEIECLADIYYQANYINNKNRGMSEDDIIVNSMYQALMVGYNYVKFCDTYPGATLSENDIKNINDSIESDSKVLVATLSGTFALAHEKLYYGNGIPAIHHVANSDEVKKLYEDNYVRAKHILVDDEATAEKVLAKIAAGEDFDALVKEYGKDPGMEGNAEGYTFSYGEMVKSFEEAAFALEIGEISTPVESDFGYHIIKREPLLEMPEEFALAVSQEIVSQEMANSKDPELLISAQELFEMLK